MVGELQRLKFHSLRRNKYIDAVKSIYDDDDLFNVFLTLNKTGFYVPPVAKAQRYGIVNSLIFYGQGDKNLDMLSMSMMRDEFKNRRKIFDEFYTFNADLINQEANTLINQPTAPTATPRVRKKTPQRTKQVILSPNISDTESDMEEMKQSEYTSNEEWQNSDMLSETSEDVKTGEGLKQSVEKQLHKLKMIKLRMVC